MALPLEPGEPEPTAGVQLFFSGMRDAGRWCVRGKVRDATDAQRAAEELHSGPVPGQLPLLWMPADLTRIEPQDAERAACAERPDLPALLARFGEARGWTSDTVRSVGRGVALLLVARSGECVVDPSALDHLVARQIPLEPTLDALSEIGITVVDPDRVMDDWIDNRLSGLPARIRSEVAAWLDVLRGRSKRRGRSYRANTVKTYVQVCQPALARWSCRYGSLRQVTADDIQTHLDALPAGWTRVNTLVGLRSLFRTLKANRLVFADPTSGVQVSVPAPRALLGVEPAVRRSLLDQVPRADHRLIVLLAGVHALSRQQVAELRLGDVDLAGRRIRVGERWRPLDELTWRHLVEWLDLRRSRWPRTANPYVLVTPKSANRVVPVGTTYLKSMFQALPTTMSGLRVDRLVSEAVDSKGDGLRIALLFGLSIQAAAGYAAAFDPSETRATEKFIETQGP